MISQEIQRGCKAIVYTCADIKSKDDVLIITNPATTKIGKFIQEIAKKTTEKVNLIEISPFTMHGQEPPMQVSFEMLHSSVVIALTSMSMAHTQARLAATNNGTRYLSLPDYSLSVLTSSALTADFRSITDLSFRIAKLFTEGNSVDIITGQDCHLICDIKGRTGNAAPGWCYGPGIMASPPDAESNIALREKKSTGSILVNASILCREIGKLKAPIKLTIEQGRVTDINGHYSQKLIDLFEKAANPAARVVAELGIGLNPLAVISGFMLEDEGCKGTIHFGIGSNVTIGGENNVAFHLDHVISGATVFINELKILENGKLIKG